MAFINCNIYSHELGGNTEVSVILPYGKRMKRKTEKFPVLYLLHGMTEDHTTWIRQTAIERYIYGMNLAVVMPQVQNNFYVNTHDGRKYFDYVNKELPAFMEEMFKISDKREDKFAAGISMGGYGAMKLGLSEPYQFGIVASMSGALDFEDAIINKNRDREHMWYYEEQLKDENNLFYLLENMDKKNIPSIYQACGSTDFLHDENIKFRDVIKNVCTDYTYYEEPARHEWGFWDRQLQSFLEFIKERNKNI